MVALLHLLQRHYTSTPYCYFKERHDDLEITFEWCYRYILIPEGVTFLLTAFFSFVEVVTAD